MDKKYYTKDGDHPEDAIHKVKEFLNELVNVQEVYFLKLVNDLNLNEDGENWLFDYIHNSGDEGNHLSFEEYISFYGKKYEDLVNETKN